MKLGRITAIVLIFIAVLLLGRQLGSQIPAFTAWIAGAGPWAPVAFIVGYAVAVVLFAPGSLLTLAAGALFGIGKGTLYVFTAATIGETAAFLISRYVARDFVERRLAGDPRFAAIDRAVAADARRIVFLLRLTPLIPFNLLNYALGLTRVRFVDYFVASLGILPGTLLYVYYGKIAGDVATITASGQIRKDAAYYGALLVGFAATVAVTTIVTRTARRALRQATQREDNTAGLA